MPTPDAHLHATRAALGMLLAGGGHDVAGAARLGLSADAARTLVSVRQTAHAGGAGWVGLTLAFAGDGPARGWPQRLRSALGGADIPLRAVRSRRGALAHSWVRAQNDVPNAMHGSLGAILRLNAEPDRLLALTAGHVCGAAQDTARGMPVRFDPQHVPVPAFFGQLLDWQPNFARLAAGTDIDAAIVEVTPDAVEALTARPTAWPTGASMAFADDALRLQARGLDIVGQGFEFLTTQLEVDGDATRTYTLRDALCWRTSVPTAGGDSGAPVWNAFDELVAIHAGGDVEDDVSRAVAVPIGPILRWAGASIVRRGEALRRAALPAGISVPRLAAAPASRPADAAIDVLARTLYGEARGEGQRGMEAVGQVVFNRVDARSWWGRDVVAVCHKPWQFSCWNANDPNRQRLLGVTGADTTFRQASDIAARLTAAQADGSRARADITAGATHYYARRLIAKPLWARGRTPCAQVGGHDFFRGIA